MDDRLKQIEHDAMVRLIGETVEEMTNSKGVSFFKGDKVRIFDVINEDELEGRIDWIVVKGPYPDSGPYVQFHCFSPGCHTPHVVSPNCIIEVLIKK